MIAIYKFLRVLSGYLHKVWIIKIQYPKKYPHSQIKSILPPSMLKNTIGLFVEENVQIKNPLLKIGKHTYIGSNTFIDSCSRIGSFCSISSGVKIGLRNHPLDFISTSPIFYSKFRGWLDKSIFDERDLKDVIIEDDVLISANVILINGVKIGRGAVVGAGSVVTMDVQPYSIVAGVPARIIRFRFSKEIIEELEESAWWTKEDQILRENVKFSNNPKIFLSKLKEQKGE